MIRHLLSPRLSARAVLVAILLLPAATAVAVLAVRTRSVLEPGGLYLATSGGEPVSIYNILKAQRGLSLYEDPRDPPYYPTTLYNVGFYRFYAAAAWPWKRDVAALVPALRLVTLCLAGLGFGGLVGFATLAWGRRAPGPRPGLAGLAMGLAGLATFFGPLTGWWVLTARPDIGAAAFAGFALLVVLGLGTDRPWLAAILAGCCVAAAWSFKQSSVLIAAGLVLSALARRRFVPAGLIVLPPVLAAAGCLSIMGPDYRANVVWATSLSAFSWQNLARMVIQVALKGGLPLLASAAVIAPLRRAAWIRPEERTTLIACWFTTLAGGLVTCCRTGSEANYFFELWVVVSLLVMIGVKLAMDSPAFSGALGRSWPAWLLVLALAPASAAWAGLDAARLAGIGDGRLGRVRLSLDADQVAEIDRARELAREAGGRVYCQPALSGLAWAPPLPAPIFDDYAYFHRPAAERGLLRGAGLEGLLDQHQYPLIVLEGRSEEILAAATAAGYVRRPGWNHLAVLDPPAVRHSLAPATAPVTAMARSASAGTR
jgi:hypothetical protein